MPPKSEKRSSTTNRSSKKKARTQLDLYDSRRQSMPGGSSAMSFARAIRAGWRKGHMSTYPVRLYTTHTALVYTNTTVSTNTFSDIAKIQMNNAFSPNGGGSAIGYGTLAANYSKCFVRACRMKATVTNQLDGTSNVVAFIFGITVDSSGSAVATNAQGALGEGNAVYTQVGANPDTKSVEVAIDMSKFFSVPNLLDNPVYASAPAASPSQICFGHFWVQTDNLTNAAQFVYTIDIQMDCVWTDPFGINA